MHKKSIQFGEFLKKEMRKQDLSSTKLAKKVGVTAASIYFWRNAQFNISLNHYYKILEVLGFEEKLERKIKNT